MPQRRLIRTAIVTVAAILVILAPATATLAADADTTPPTAPYINYASGLQWFGPCSVTVGLQRSTDDVTPQSDLTYEVFADGVYLGTLIDRGTDSGVWGGLKLQHGGSNTITAKAVDAAGNRSAPSNAQVITGYGC
jgi:hypothetical protein